MVNRVCKALCLGLVLGALACPGAAAQAETDDAATASRRQLPPKTKTVIILGGGMAGVAAAKKIREEEKYGPVDIILLEAGSQLGGRMRSSALNDGTVIEEGASWIYGKSGPEGRNPIYNQAIDEADLDFHKINKDSTSVYDESASDATDTVSDGKIDWGTLNKAISRFDRNQKDVWKCAMGKRPRCKDPSYQELLVKGGWIAKSVMDHFIEWYYTEFDFGVSPEVTGSSAKRRPLKPFGEEDVMISDQAGFASMLEPLIPFTQIHYNCKVTKVIYNKKLVRIRVERNWQGGNPTVEEFKGDFAIVTFPLGVLKESIGLGDTDLVEFDPELPSWKREALESLTIVNREKVFLQFSSSFWNNRKEFQLFAQFNTGKFAHWHNLNEVTEFSGKNIIQGTVVGKNAEMISFQSDDQVIAEAMAELRKFFPGAPDPIDYKITRWLSDEFARGAGVDAPRNADPDEEKGTVGRIGWPIDNTLWFAGDATHYQNYGTLAGAWQSGKLTGENVVKCAHRRRCPKKFKP